MKIRFSAFAFVLFLFLNAMPESAWPGLEIDRVWSKHGYGYALVTYTNDSGGALRRVMVQCIALGQNGEKLSANDWLFFSHQDGPIQPGATDTQEVLVSLHGANMKSMSCKPKIKR